MKEYKTVEGYTESDLKDMTKKGWDLVTVYPASLVRGFYVCKAVFSRQKKTKKK